ncbi:MAG: cupin domain-containing protein [Parachlamydiaceae bacterium]|nr:cupin domain-containing protein [Parachlamydiaceae bacterium]
MDVKFFEFDKLPFEKVTDKVYRHYVWGEKIMLVYFKLEKGAIVPEHHHPNEQVTYILKGSVEVTTQGKKYVVKQGEVLILPANVPHRFEALEDCIDLDVFSPPRQDWLDGTDSYLKK